MDFSLILLVIGFIVVAYFIFKLIKKIVFAIITFVVFVILIISSVFGLVYLDYNHLASQSNFDVHLIYGSSDSVEFGINIPVENKSLNFDGVSSFDSSSLGSVNLDDVEDEFYIFVDKELFKSLLKDDKSYYLIGTENFEIMGFKIDTSLSSVDVLDILSSKTPDDLYVKTILAKNDIPSLVADSVATIAGEEISKNLNNYNLKLNEALFISVFKDSIGNGASLVDLINGFKDKQLEVYPDRFTFKLVRLLPVDTIVSFIPDFAME